MAELRYIEGDVSRPEKTCFGHKLIIHVCNNKLRWGSGFVIALSKRWNEPYEAYRSSKMIMGECSLAAINKEVAVFNMIAQQGIGWSDGVPAIRYDALRGCLRRVRDLALHMKSSIHAPRLGAGRAGGEWGKIEQTLREELVDYGIDVYIYDLPGNRDKYAFNRSD